MCNLKQICMAISVILYGNELCIVYHFLWLHATLFYYTFNQYRFMIDGRESFLHVMLVAQSIIIHFEHVPILFIIKCAISYAFNWTDVKVHAVRYTSPRLFFININMTLLATVANWQSPERNNQLVFKVDSWFALGWSCCMRLCGVLPGLSETDDKLQIQSVGLLWDSKARQTEIGRI